MIRSTSSLRALILAPALLLGVAFDSSARDSPRLREPVRLEAIGPHDVLAPCLTDVNGDGKLDVLAGNFAGQLLLRLNEGSKTKPCFKSEQALQSGGRDVVLEHW